MPLTAPQRRALAWGALALATALFLKWLAPVLTPFVVAALLAYALHPLVERWHRAGLPRPLGAGVAIALLGSALLGVLLLIVPVVTQQLPLLREQVPGLLERLNTWVTPLAARAGLDVQVNVEQVREWLRVWLADHDRDVLSGLLTSLSIGGSALAALLGHLVLTPIVAFYLLLDWSLWVQRSRQMVPPHWREATDRFLEETDAVLGQYLRGQLLVMATLALFYTVALALVGLQLALPIGVFTGLAVFVPYLGFGLGLVLALLAALLQFEGLSGVWMVAGVYLAGQLLESFYLTPRLLGERIGLHPIAVIFALMAFGHLFGFVGVLVALPVSAVLLVALRRLRAWYLSSSLYRPDAPPPNSPPGEAPPP